MVETCEVHEVAELARPPFVTGCAPSSAVSALAADVGVSAEAAKLAAPLRLLLICGSPHDEEKRPAGQSASGRLVALARHALAVASLPVQVEVLETGRLATARRCGTRPAAGCDSMSMRQCQEPFSGRVGPAFDPLADGIGDVHESWAAAHGVLLLTSVPGDPTPSGLTGLLDRLVAADGGNAGRQAVEEVEGVDEAVPLRSNGRPCSTKPAGRAYGMVVWGDVLEVLNLRRTLADRLDRMGLIDAGELARFDRFIGCDAPYASGHEALEGDEPGPPQAVQDEVHEGMWEGVHEIVREQVEEEMREVRHVAQALVHAASEIRAGRLPAADRLLARARPL